MTTVVASTPVPDQRTPAGEPAAPEPVGRHSTPRSRSPRQPQRVAATIAVIGLLLTAASTWAAARVDGNTEQRLLEGQSKQVGVVLSTTIQVIQSSLGTALTVHPRPGAPSIAPFRRAVGPSVGDGKLFAAVSLWHREGGQFVRTTSVGDGSALRPGGSSTSRFLREAVAAPTFAVESVTTGGQTRIVYAVADEASGYVVTAERKIPSSRRSPVDRNSAFADLHYAIYLGPDPTLAALSTTDVDPATLPLTGRTTRTVLPFGNTVLTVDTAPRRHLGATLSRRLPLILLLGGVLLTLVAASAGRQLVRRRLKAEDDAAVLTQLYDRVEALYGQERVLSERLQRALLPPVLPEVPELDVAVEYVAGAQGVEIGGDWYSLVRRDEDHFAFVIGDVSGRGVDAVAVMARARFTLRAYLLRGDGPATALEMCSHQFDIVADGHMATVMVGVGSWRTGEITIANAGHPQPLLLTSDAAEYVEAATGPPLGIGPTRYEETSFVLPPGGTLFCFTDGLIERRDESIDVGMRRLADLTRGRSGGTVDDLVDHAVRTLRSDDAADDIAVLALRRRPVP